MPVSSRHPLNSLFALAVLFLASCSGHWEEKEIEIGYQGPARWNPFLAAERFLTEMGYETESTIALGELEYAGETLVIPAHAVPAYGIARDLTDWISSGGHLVYLHHGGERFRNDWLTDWEAMVDYDELEDKEAGLLKELDIKLKEMKSNPESIRLGKDTLAVEIPSKLGFVDPNAPRKNKKARKPKPFLTFEYGAGRVTLLSHAFGWRNRNIGEKDHAHLLLRVIELHPTDAVRLVIGGRTSLWGMLWHYGWMALTGLILVVALWLWANLVRFGPRAVAENPSSLDFFEHITQTGKFLWSNRCSDALLEPLRRSVILANLKKFHGPAHDDTGGEYSRLAEHIGMPVTVVEEALTKTKISDAAEMTRIVRTLQQIQATL